MSPPRPSRREWLGAVTAVGVTGLVAGCATGPEEDPRESETSRIDLIPAGATAAVRIDVAGLRSDATVRERANELLGEIGESTTTVESTLDQAQQEIGLDPREVDEILAFSTAGDSNSVAMLVWAEWSEGMLSASEDLSDSLSEDSYNGTTVYRATDTENTMLAVLETGVFAVGPTAGVELSIDVWNGDAEPVGGELREAITTATGGYAQFGFDPSIEMVPPFSKGRFDFSILEDITYGYGSMTADSTDFRLTIQMDSDRAASDLADRIPGVLSEAESELTRPITSSRLRETLRQSLDRTTVRTDGRTVSVTNSDGVVAFTVWLAMWVDIFLINQGNVGPVTPPARFDFDYDAGQQTLTVTHEAGEPVQERELFVQGEGVPDGRWRELGGSVSGTTEGEPAVVAGDSLTLTDVDPAVEMYVVWRSAAGDESSTYGAFEGPDAD